MSEAPLPTALELLRKATTFLEGKGVGNPRLDAECLLADVLGVDRVGVYLNFDRPLVVGEIDRYRELVRRRGTREPLQHIRGRQEFWSRDFSVDRRVLVPRAETELVVEEALAEARETSRPSILDVGVGSGAIAVTLALELPESTVAGTDASSEALAVARENAGRHGVAGRVDLREGELVTPLTGESFDLVVSNPPYVTTGELESLEPEVRDFEPRVALDGGPDGLETIRRLVADVSSVLAPGGRLVLEIGQGQREAVAELLPSAGLRLERVREDLAGIERVLVISRDGAGRG